MELIRITNNSCIGLQSISICKKLYCKLTNGIANLLDNVDHVFNGIYKVRALIDGSGPSAAGNQLSNLH